MKKTRSITIIAAFIVVATTLFVVLLNSCGKQEETIELVHYEVPTFTWDTPVSTSNGVMDLAEISVVLAELTNEDGTGETNLNMTWQEIAAVLDGVGIPYETQVLYEDIANITTANGNMYWPNQGSFMFKKTKSGLTISDPISRAIEIYSEPDKVVVIEFSDNCYYYCYNMGKTFCKAQGKDQTVVMGLETIDDTIIGITIGFLYDWQEADFWN